MRCSYCRRSLRLLDPSRPLRALLPRCRACDPFTFGAAHKAVIVLLAAALALLIGGIFSSLPNL
jgi:hypothetical protein